MPSRLFLDESRLLCRNAPGGALRGRPPRAARRRGARRRPSAAPSAPPGLACPASSCSSPQQAPPLAVIERVAPGHLRRELGHHPLLRGDALRREHQVLDPPVTLARLPADEPAPLQLVRDRVTNDASHPIRCASSFIASTPSSLNSASRSCGRDPEPGRDRLPDRPGPLDQRGERVEDVPVQRRCRVFSLRWTSAPTASGPWISMLMTS